MKKSNIIIIIFLAIFVVSLIWLFVWMKNHAKLSEVDNPAQIGQTFQSEQMLQPFKVLSVKEGINCVIEESDSINMVSIESANKNFNVKNIVNQKGDTLFVAWTGCSTKINIKTNHKIENMIVEGKDGCSTFYMN